MDTNSKDQFKKLAPEEKNKILVKLILFPEEIICKSMKDLFVVTPVQFKSPQKLFVKFLQNEPDLHGGEELISQFLLNNENLYIFKCEYIREAYLPCLLLSEDFYMIQRRENYRLKFPNSITSKVLVSWRGNTLVGKVSDLSTTGIRVSTTQKVEDLNTGDDVKIELQVTGHEPLRLEAHIRHRTEANEIIKDKKVLHYYFGFQFVRLTAENNKNLSRINMELYRNFLQKVTG